MVTPEQITKIDKDIRNLYNRVDECMEKVDKVQDTTNRINNDTHEVLLAMKGNPLNKQDNGLIGMIMQHDERIKKMEKIIDRVTWVAIGAALFGGYGISQIIDKIMQK